MQTSPFSEFNTYRQFPVSILVFFQSMVLLIIYLRIINFLGFVLKMQVSKPQTY